MAYLSGLGGDAALWQDHIRPAADFLVANGPSDGVERWEEQTGYSPSTIAAEIAGLTAASAIAASHGDTARANLYQATADDFQRNIKTWTVTTTGPYAPRYFIRLSKTGDPNAAISYSLGNGGPTLDQRSVARRRLPGTGPARRASGHRPRHPGLAGRARQAHRGVHAERHRLLPVRQLGRQGQRGRVRRLLPAEPGLLHGPRGTVAADRHRHRAPVAGPVRRARRVRSRRRGRQRRGSPCSRR